ncbi:MAG TPA: phage holin family protein [Candidatus Colwellbacteria bacterium]|nr:phage holin family protein [Candidatus Colwellbacteria bacterium]
MKTFINWVISAVAIIIAAYVLPGVNVDGFLAALVLAVVLGAINAFIKPIILFLTFPINIVTLGLFTLVINAGLVILASYIVPGFSVASFWWAMLFSIVLSFVTTVFSSFGSNDK